METNFINGKKNGENSKKKEEIYLNPEYDLKSYENLLYFLDDYQENEKEKISKEIEIPVEEPKKSECFLIKNIDKDIFRKTKFLQNNIKELFKNKIQEKKPNESISNFIQNFSQSFLTVEAKNSCLNDEDSYY